MEELRTNKENGSKWVFFYDDNFIANRKRTKELLETMIEEGVTPNWTAQLRVEVAKDPELIDLMVKSGCHTVYIGFESVNPATLEAYNKSQSLEDIEYCIETLHKAGIRIHGMFVLGSDEDTVDTLHKTLNSPKRTNYRPYSFLCLLLCRGQNSTSTLKRRPPYDKGLEPVRRPSRCLQAEEDALLRTLKRDDRHNKQVLLSLAHRG